jgi:hypothetical protein
VAHVVGRDSGVCWICGHPGAGVGDHVIPVAERLDLELDVSNIKAAHGYLKSGGGECPVCSAAATVKAGKEVKIYCNEIKGGLSAERARRIISERTGMRIAPGQKTEGNSGERDWD